MNGDELSTAAAVACWVLGSALGVVALGVLAYLGRHHRPTISGDAVQYDQANTITRFLTNLRGNR